MTSPLSLELLTKNNQAAQTVQTDRRGFLKAGAMVTAALGFWMPSLGHAAAPVMGREIQLFNAHTGEKFKGEYWYAGKYLPDAFGAIKSVMKDHRTGEKFPIDPRLMDILYVLHNKIGSRNSFEVLSGYRSPKSNAMLRHNTEGVAKQSLHMTGQAIDIRLPGTKLTSVRASALALKSGGVGYYPRTGFVHIDTGRFRSW